MERRSANPYEHLVSGFSLLVAVLVATVLALAALGAALSLIVTAVGG